MDLHVPALREQARLRGVLRVRHAVLGLLTHEPGLQSEKDAVSAQNSAHLRPFIAVFPQGCMGQPASFGPTQHHPLSLLGRSAPGEERLLPAPDLRVRRQRRVLPPPAL
jgi:hypothetical protein